MFVSKIMNGNVSGRHASVSTENMHIMKIITMQALYLPFYTKAGNLLDLLV